MRINNNMTNYGTYNNLSQNKGKQQSFGAIVSQEVVENLVKQIPTKNQKLEFLDTLLEKAQDIYDIKFNNLQVEIQTRETADNIIIQATQGKYLGASEERINFGTDRAGSSIATAFINSIKTASQNIKNSEEYLKDKIVMVAKALNKEN